jgi:two-component system, probable response regulator PhcQ
MPRILLVDDDRGVLRSLGRVIHFMPMSQLHGEAVIESFEEPMLALERVAQCEFDLIIADYLMPKMHGVAFIRQLNVLHSHAPRLMLTGHMRVLEYINAVNGLGAVELMAKPWDDDMLRQAIARLLKSRREQRGMPIQMMAPAMQAPSAR